MKRKRKQYSGAFKARVGLEALLGIKTPAQIAREQQVHPLLIGQWKAIRAWKNVALRGVIGSAAVAWDRNLGFGFIARQSFVSNDQPGFEEAIFQES